MRGLFLFALAVGIAPSAGLADPPEAVPVRELDGLAVAVLKEMHNRGAELYNAGDAAGCLKVYATALLTAKPFLKHRPATQKMIDDGLAEAVKSDDAKLQAFGLHKLFLRVRADLDAEAPVAEGSISARMSGALTREGKPISDAVITVSRTGRAFTTSTDGRGRFDFTDRMPPGKYAVIITGYGVSEKYASVATTDIAVSLGSGENVRDIALDSK